jgi:hypothetical protein
MAAMDVIVQRVRTTWSKRSRGFPDATLRNAAPTAFELPSGRPPLFHDVALREEHDFEPQVKVLHGLPPRHEFGLRLVGTALRVQLPNGFGVPVRSHRPVLLLQPGEWVRWQLNNRWSSATGMGDWHYTLTTVSIALGPMPLDTFLGEAPHVIDEKAALR